MDHSMAQGAGAARPAPMALALAPWKEWIAIGAAALLAITFLVSGLWKLTDPLGASARMIQALVPRQLAVLTAIGVGVAEAWTGVMLVVPRWRRWGAVMGSLLLVVFMAYMGWNYHALAGADCSCFPWLKRIVGPVFFISDAAMLVLALPIYFWSRSVASTRNALVALGAIAVFSGAFYGATVTHQRGVRAPETITVAGKPVPLQEGRVFLFFFDPQCMHCDAAAKAMSKYNWASDVKAYAIPTATPQWGPDFLSATKFQAGLSLDLDPLRKVFHFGDPPYAVALEDGYQVQAFPAFDEQEPLGGLKKIGFVH